MKSAVSRYLVRWIKPKFLKLSRVVPRPKLLLDIGIANDSYEESKTVFQGVAYHGLDVADAAIELQPGDQFFLRNLEDPGALNGLLPEYDAIIANHVLEHIKRGPEVFGGLCRLLAPGGALYAEVPSIRTAQRPKSQGSYHFHDDPTHCRVYRLEDLANIAMDAGCCVVSCGPASTPLKDLLSIPRALVGIVRGHGWGPYLLHLQRKIDHILVQRSA